MTDGGDVENYGLVSLLRRRVSAIIVFINTVWPLSLEYDPTTWPDDDEDARRAIDPFLAPLFGGPSTRFPHNQVFAKSDFADVVSSLQAAKRTGQTVMAVCSHRVRANEWWGVAGGWDVRICWMYNERVGQWEHRLAPDIRRLIEEGRAAAGAGPVEHFPHYLTRGQNPGRLIQLTPTQVNLLAHLACLERGLERGNLQTASIWGSLVVCQRSSVGCGSLALVVGRLSLAGGVVTAVTMNSSSPGSINPRSRLARSSIIRGSSRELSHLFSQFFILPSEHGDHLREGIEVAFGTD